MAVNSRGDIVFAGVSTLRRVVERVLAAAAAAAAAATALHIDGHTMPALRVASQHSEREFNSQAQSS